MKTRISRIIFLCLTFLSITATVSAQDYFGDYDCCCQQNYDCCNTCCGSDMGRFYAGADWLYWKPSCDGLNYGKFSITESTTIGGVGSEAFSEKVLKPDFKWDNGYRVYAGYEMPCSCWDFGIIYTHAPNTTADSSAFIVPPIVTPAGTISESITIDDLSLFDTNGVLNSGGLVPFSLISVATRWSLDFDYADFDFANTICVSDCLLIRPHFGVRYLWAKQRFKMAATGAFAVTGDSAYAGSLENRSWGAGVEGGFWGDLEIARGLSILGHVGGAILYGKHKIRVHIAKTVAPSTFFSGSSVAIAFKDDERTSIPMLDYFIGLQYVTCLKNFEVNFHVGWEQHVAFAFNRFTRTDGNDLSVQGLTLGGGFAF